MICDENTCPERHVDEKFHEQRIRDIDEDDFIKNLKHEKCKIIQLVRRQIHKFYDTQYKVSPISNGWQARYMQESSDSMLYKIKREENVTEKVNSDIPNNLLVRSTMSTGQAWCLRALRKIRKRICVMVVIAGVVVMMLSIYGIYFRAYLCGNGKSCVTSLRYTHVKHALF
ncbi:hypothetical protein QLX08_011253 [Tetragonisca angustula]|uniref:Uncharacterized protein n=1 Tax=Tetragonisca angustula TaxID=166442 RepID=A0AAW0Z8V9_9HYME